MERSRLQYMRDILASRPMYVFVDVMHGKRRIGEVIEINNWTTWVKIMIGAKTSILIKRHNTKHHVTPCKMGEYYGSIYTETGD
jgi:hypothetical protein